MADGVGGFFGNLLFNNPMGQLNQALAGPQPGQGGSAPAAGGGQQGAASPPSGGAPLPAPQATQSPVDLASLYMKLERSREFGDSLNRHLAGFLGGFKGPPGGAQQIMQSMAGGGSQDPGALLQNLLQLRQTQQLANMPAPEGVDRQLWDAMGPTERAQLSVEIAKQRAGLGGPPDAQDMERDLQRYMKDNGIMDRNDPRIPATYRYINQYKAASQGETKATEDIGEYKRSATQDYATLDSKLEKGLTTVNQLLGKTPGSSFEDTITALKTPKPTTGLVAANMPSLGGYNPLSVSEGVSNQAVAIKTLIGEMSAEAMQGIKNIRNKAEFGAVVSSLTGQLDAANSPEKIKVALELARDKLLRARAVATAAAGHKLTGDLVGQLGQESDTFLNPKSPYYQGATEEEAPKPKNDNTRIKIYNPKTGEIE